MAAAEMVGRLLERYALTMEGRSMSGSPVAVPPEGGLRTGRVRGSPITLEVTRVGGKHPHHGVYRVSQMRVGILIFTGPGSRIHTRPSCPFFPGITP